MTMMSWVAQSRSCLIAPSKVRSSFVTVWRSEVEISMQRLRLCDSGSSLSRTVPRRWKMIAFSSISKLWANIMITA